MCIRDSHGVAALIEQDVAGLEVAMDDPDGVDRLQCPMQPLSLIHISEPTRPY